MTDTTGGTGNGYLATFQASLPSDGNTPLQITNQANATGGATPPSLITGGFGGIDILQNAVATTGPVMNYSSPILRMCAQEEIGKPTSMATNVCWSAQVQGGAMANPTNVIAWTTDGTAHDLTMLFPPSVNLATAPTTGPTPTAGQITVGPAPVTMIANANVPATFTGASTGNGTSSAAAGPIILVPGQLTNGSPNPAATEGALEVLQSYLGTNNSGTNFGLLACPSGTTQSVIPCTTTGALENWVGVFDNNPAQAGGTVTPQRYGRVPIQNHGAAAQWTSGDFVCKDDVNASYVIDNDVGGVNTPCPAGESIGVAVGDPSSTNSHLVDLIPEASVGGAVSQGLVLQFNCSGPDNPGSTTYLNGQPCNTTTNTTEFPLPYQSGTYRFKNLYINYKNTPATGDTVTLWVAGSATGISCNPNPLGTAPCPDVTHAATITPTMGRDYSIRVAPAAGSTMSNILVTIQLQ